MDSKKTVMDLASKLEDIDVTRNNYRRVAGRILRDNSSLIEDEMFRKKIQDYYLKDLRDSTVVLLLIEIASKLGDS